MDAYDLNKSIASFAVANDFIITLNKVSLKLGCGLQPFCFYAGDTQKQAGVFDFTTFQGLVDSSRTLEDEIVTERAAGYAGFNMSVDIKDPLKRRMLFFDYLMTTSVCYVEVPKFVTKAGMAMQSFDKYLCTKNPYIMQIWMGADSVSEMQTKYSSKLQPNSTDMYENVVKYVKLGYGAKGNTISMPRKFTSVEKMTVIPLFMIATFVRGMRPSLEEGIVRCEYLKDNGTVRRLDTTINANLLQDMYKDNGFVATMLQNTDIDGTELGALHVSSKMGRGYIKVPEVGASVYDATGARSLNINRLLTLRKIDKTEADLSCINVDLASVVQNFKDCIDYANNHMPETIPVLYKSLLDKEPDGRPNLDLIFDIYTDVDGKSAFLSTQFHKSLHGFMIANPAYFPLYTGKPNATITSSQNFGLEEMDF